MQEDMQDKAVRSKEERFNITGPDETVRICIVESRDGTLLMALDSQPKRPRGGDVSIEYRYE